MSTEDILAILMPALSITESKNNDDNKLEADAQILDYSFSHPFLAKSQTIDFIKKSKVMFINRGLPGSGKSTLTRKIAEIYGVENAVICSGDDFFMDKNGNYKFEAAKLSEAHSSAQKKAKSACSSGKSPVIVDNTNIKAWELKPYFEIAKKSNYIVILTEPRTPFKFDVSELFKHGKHNVPREVIEAKKNQFENIVPLYFGLFLNETDAEIVLERAKYSLDQCFKNFLKFRNDINKFAKTNSVSQAYTFKNTDFHCTTKYIGPKNKRSESNAEYYKHLEVGQRMGEALNLKIVGFCVGRSTISAIVSLHDTQKFLWQNFLSDKDTSDIFEHPFYEYRDARSEFEKLGHGALAHITLALGPGVQAKQSGHDLVHANLRFRFSKTAEDVPERVNLDDMELIYLKDMYCLVKLKEALIFKSMFTGWY